MSEKKKWSDFSTGQQAAIVVVATLEVALTAVALVDLARRPSAGVRGPKALWALGCVIQPFGPVVYLGLGRRSVASEVIMER